MRQRDDKTHLQYILEMIALIEQQLDARGARQRLLDDMFFRFGIYHALQTMTESTQKLSGETKALMPEIPWQKISDFRNVLVHDYLGDVDPVTVLRIIDVYLPQLKAAISKCYP